MEITQVLLAPVVTEKSTNSQTLNKYTFMVHLKATKVDVRNAVEKAYGVKVTSVNTIPVLKKVRMAGRNRQITKRHTGRKVLVTLAPKQSIDFNKVKTS
jgi:large subunit ribosomal protein L23